MFDKCSRIHVQNKILDCMKDIIGTFVSTDRDIGNVVCATHIIAGLLVLYGIVCKDKDSLYFKLSSLIFLGIFVFHIYFDGCLLTKLEKRCWKSETWKGPISLVMEPLGMVLTPRELNCLYMLCFIFGMLFVANKAEIIKLKL